MLHGDEARLPVTGEVRVRTVDHKPDGDALVAVTLVLRRGMGEERLGQTASPSPSPRRQTLDVHLAGTACLGVGLEVAGEQEGLDLPRAWSTVAKDRSGRYAAAFVSLAQSSSEAPKASR